jgi:hypothetical protein
MRNRKDAFASFLFKYQNMISMPGLKTLFASGLFFFLSQILLAQQGQLNIPRVDQMPDIPQPYLMRNWDDVANKYDAFVFDPAKSGEHLPVIAFRPAGVNYPSLQPILLDTYIGSTSTNQAEAINIIPAIVGASLAGIDKSQQNGVNWVEKTKDFFNSKNTQNVYLNGYSASSGSDWWYDLMPNIFFYQLSTFYEDPDYDQQFVSIADKWLEAVNTMGASETPWITPNMNYRGWYLSSMTGNTNGVREPEAAGTIAWILYHAWLKTNNEKYLNGAQHAIEYLSSLTSNPSYELQLPYGILIAAKLNARLGTHYDINKMINWSFNRGPLRGWGAIVGTWDGKDVSGLIGEANDTGNDYAFIMNGFQQAAALAPVMKYDKRYARAISKWILNLANATRLFYPAYLDQAKQDDYNWSQQHDPNSVIAYEALKENWEGKALYGTGDAKRNGWAATNLGLYGSSHVGYLAAVVDPTNVEGILKLDLNATDFFGDHRFATYAYFNPYGSDQQILIPVGPDQYDIYDAISESVVANGTGDIILTVKAGEVMIVSLLPSGATLTNDGGKLRYGDFVVDYHYGYDFNPLFRIKSVASSKSAYEFGELIDVYATIDNAPSGVTYQWFANEQLIPEATGMQLQWTAPSVVETYIIRVEATSDGNTISDEIEIQVLEEIPDAPVIEGLQTEGAFFYENDEVEILCEVTSAGTESLTYQWEIPAGTFEQDDSVVFWHPPSEGLHVISCTVTNSFALSSTNTKEILVKNNTEPAVSPLAYYPLNINANDYSGHGFDAEISETSEADDPQGNSNFAYAITTTDDMINVPNAVSLNFVDEITLSCWFKISATGREAFILSHGSWEERLKISLTPDLKIRWTVKTSSGVKDLDSKEPVVPGQFYHIAAVYSGYSMELYIDGELDNYASHQGSMLATDDDLTFGQKSTSDTQYFLNGVIDEVRIFNNVVQPWQIAGLKDLWTDEVPTAIGAVSLERVTAYPNPANDGFVYVAISPSEIKEIRLIEYSGRSKPLNFSAQSNSTRVDIKGAHGSFVLEVTTRQGIKHFRIITFN